MSKQGKPTKRKGSDLKLKQPLMGDFVSKQNRESQKKPKKNRFAKMSSFIWTRGSYMDTEEYRNNYPGKKDNPNLDDNYNFYMNQIPSKPDGDFIDNIHSSWWGDYAKLERHHGYIQWLFPIRDSGMNWHAQELQLHEIEKLTKEKKAMKRVLESYKLMLDFYGMKLANEEDGTIERSDNYRNRFRNLNRSYHNYLRITRILKCLGELNYEHLKVNFVRFVLYEGIIKGTLPNCIDSCLKYWVGVIRSEEERGKLLDYYDELCDRDDAEKEKEESEEDDEDDNRMARSRASMNKILSTSPKPTRRQVSKESSSDDGTLNYAMNLISTDDEELPEAKKEKKDHEMSDSDIDDVEFQTPGTGDSQEMNYWNADNKSSPDSIQQSSDAAGGEGEITEDIDEPSDQVPGKSDPNADKVLDSVDNKKPTEEATGDKVPGKPKADGDKALDSTENKEPTHVTSGDMAGNVDAKEQLQDGESAIDENKDTVTIDENKDTVTNNAEEKQINAEAENKVIVDETDKTNNENSNEMEVDEANEVKDNVTAASQEEKPVKLDGTEEYSQNSQMEMDEDEVNTKL